MAANVNQEIKEAMKEKKILIGSRTVMKGVKRGHVDSVIYASNCPEETRKDLEYYSKGGFLGLKVFQGNSVQLERSAASPSTCCWWA